VYNGQKLQEKQIIQSSKSKMAGGLLWSKLSAEIHHSFVTVTNTVHLAKVIFVRKYTDAGFGAS